MSSLKYSKPERISLKGHPELNERWVQERIAEDPSLLELGDLILKTKSEFIPKGAVSIFCARMLNQTDAMKSKFNLGSLTNPT